MANLIELINLMDVKMEKPATMVFGKKRRYWIEDNNNQGTTREQLDNNQRTTREQLDNNQITTREQLDNNQRTTREQLDNNQGTTREQLDNNQRTTREQLDNNQITTREQPGNDPDNSQMVIINLIKGLIGLQKKLLYYIFDLCLERDELTTGYISSIDISRTINCSYTTFKVILARLEKKGLLKRLKGKACKGGFIHLEISKELKLFMIKTREQPGNNQGTTREQPGNDPGNNVDSSSSILYLKETTTTDDNPIPADWKNIDIEPLAELGFSTDCLTQLISQNNLSSQIVQDSIYAFAFDIKENGKLKTVKGDPISFFIGILKRSGRYVPPSNFESPQERCMRLYNERMAELEVKKAEVEKKALDCAFKDWFLKLTDEQKKEFLPKSWSSKSAVSLDKNKMLLSCAKSHFEKEVWPDVKSKIESGKENL